MNNDCPICGVPAMHGMSDVCSNPECQEAWRLIENKREREQDLRDEAAQDTWKDEMSEQERTEYGKGTDVD